MLTSILLYLLKASIALGFFYLLHILVLKGQTRFQVRRVYLLGAAIFSFLFPLIKMDRIAFSGGSQAVTMPIVQLDEILITVATNAPQITWVEILSVLAILVSFALMLRFAIQLISLVRVLNKLEFEKRDSYKLSILQNNSETASFSFLNRVVINASSEEEKKSMLVHELCHVRQKHSIDVLVYEIVCIVMWWNPFAWLMRKEMRLNLEYIADEEVKSTEQEAKKYQYLLLTQLTKANTGIALVNNFNVSQIKKRITMMNKKKTSIFSAVKYLLAIPLAVLLIQCNTSTDELISNENKAKGVALGEMVIRGYQIKKPFDVVEQMPTYKGGNDEMLKFIGDNLKFPTEAVEGKVEGRVMIRFTVTKTGKVDDVRVMRGLSPECDREAVRVVKMMPDWNIGKQDGEEVDVYFNLPIMFRLKK